MAPQSTPDTLAIQSRERADALDITARVQTVVEASGVERGLCHVYVPHTTAGILINENADPDVMRDFIASLERQIPSTHGYQHAEGNAAAHIKSTLTGTSQLVPVRQRQLALGRWQGIFFVEFDGPRDRQVHVTVVPA